MKRCVAIVLIMALCVMGCAKADESSAPESSSQTQTSETSSASQVSSSSSAPVVSAGRKYLNSLDLSESVWQFFNDADRAFEEQGLTKLTDCEAEEFVLPENTRDREDLMGIRFFNDDILATVVIVNTKYDLVREWTVVFWPDDMPRGYEDFKRISQVIVRHMTPPGDDDARQQLAVQIMDRLFTESDEEHIIRSIVDNGVYFYEHDRESDQESLSAMVYEEYVVEREYLAKLDAEAGLTENLLKFFNDTDEVFTTAGLKPLTDSVIVKTLPNSEITSSLQFTFLYKRNMTIWVTVDTFFDAVTSWQIDLYSNDDLYGDYTEVDYDELWMISGIIVAYMSPGDTIEELQKTTTQLMREFFEEPTKDEYTIEKYLENKKYYYKRVRSSDRESLFVSNSPTK